MSLSIPTTFARLMLPAGYTCAHSAVRYASVLAIVSLSTSEIKTPPVHLRAPATELDAVPVSLAPGALSGLGRDQRSSCDRADARPQHRQARRYSDPRLPA